MKLRARWSRAINLKILIYTFTALNLLALEFPSEYFMYLVNEICSYFYENKRGEEKLLDK